MAKIRDVGFNINIKVNDFLDDTFISNHFSDSEIVHRLVLDSIATRVRNRSTSKGRRSYSAQTRPIAPASHSRDIEARYSDSWKGLRFVNHTDSSGSEKSNNERDGSYRSASHHQRPKTLQIVEVGSAPYKYSVVRHVEEPQSESVREGM